jgi:hypothetical protein
MGNNPVNGIDPDGTLFFIIPSVSYSKGGGLDISLTVGVGVPGLLSVQLTVGYGFKSDNTYVSLGGTAAGLTASVGYGTQTGFTAGLNYGFASAIPNGFGTNMTSMGISYSESGGFGANAFGATYSGQTGKFGFDPSISYSGTKTYGKKVDKSDPNNPPSGLMADVNSDGHEGAANNAWDTNGDGQLSLSEANDWSRANGGDITVEAEGVDFSKSDVKFNERGQGFANLQKDNPFKGGLVYGTLELKKEVSGNIRISRDEYNFAMHSWKTDAGRNIGTIMGRIYAGPFPMHPYNINFHGNANLNYAPPPQYFYPKP